MVLLFVGWVALVGIWSAGFIGVKCYSSAPATRAPAVAPPDGIAGYTRAEAFTYLTLPEWFIVYSTDEYAAFIATRRPSTFPYLGSVRQYWGFYSSACAETKRKHPFETGYHVMLGVIGASFTIESSIRFVYEHTVGTGRPSGSRRRTPQRTRLRGRRRASTARSCTARPGTSFHSGRGWRPCGARCR